MAMEMRRTMMVRDLAAGASAGVLVAMLLPIEDALAVATLLSIEDALAGCEVFGTQATATSGGDRGA